MREWRSREGPQVRLSAMRFQGCERLQGHHQRAFSRIRPVKVSDWVLVHAGYGIEIIDEQFANETLELIAQFPELIDEDHPGMGEGVA